MEEKHVTLIRVNSSIAESDLSDFSSVNGPTSDAQVTELPLAILRHPRACNAKRLRSAFSKEEEEGGPVELQVRLAVD